MSGPVLQQIIGSINTFAINQQLAVNQLGGSFRIDFSLVDEEFIGTAFILGKINAIDVLCVGPNANVKRVPMRAGALPPGCRRVERPS